MIAYLALGSNLGDRAAMIAQATALLAAHPQIRITGQACLYETEPVGMAESSGWFLNTVVEIETGLSAEALLAVCLDIERHQGRERNQADSAGPEPRRPSRTLDLDILFYGSDIIDRPGLSVPHPRLHQRAFVLVPLLELAPDWVHPALKKSIRQLHLELGAMEEVRVYGAAPELSGLGL